MKKNLTELVFILDRSGSMGGLEQDTIGGFNAMLTRQKEQEGEANVTTILFDHEVQLLHDRFPLKAVAPLTEKDYYVRGCTALLDAIGYGVEKMVMISTDKAVNPTNVMGCTKRLAEIYVQSLGQAIVSGRIEGRTQFITTRFGNVLGSNGSVIPRFREQIEHGGPVTVTHPEIRRYFMTIPEACRLVMEAATIGRGNTIFVFDMGECVKIAELARRMIALAGFRVDQDIRIVYTGLRPGEKLYEEVLSNTENTLPTAHEKIRIAKVREYDYEEACRDVEELERLAREFDIPNVVRLMKRIVPEYHSQNSRFEIYDRELEEERTA